MKKLFPIFAFVLASSFSANAAKGGVGSIFAGLLGGAVGSAAGKAMAEPKTVEKALVTMTNKLNQTTPMTIDADTRWDKTTAGQGSRFTYNYTIVSATSREFDKGVLPDFFKNGVTVGYSYRASDGVFLAKLDITPKDCGYAT